MEDASSAFGNGRCGVLCQHPGCWYAEIKPPPAVQKRPSEYSHYLAELATRKRLRGEKEEPNDSYMHSYTVDGLPTLKVQTLNQSGLDDHRRSATLPTSLHLHSIRRRHRRPSNLVPGTPRVNYTQISLEEDNGQYDLTGLVFKPVLIWKPRQKVSAPLTNSPDIRRKAVKSPDQLSSLTAAAECPDAKIRPCSGDKMRPCSSEKASRDGIRSSMSLYRAINLTDTLPPFKKSPAKVTTSQKSPAPRQLSNPDSLSLSYLGDIELPPQVVEEILQQLRSGSTSNTNLDTHASSGVSQKSKTPPPSLGHTLKPTPHIPTSLSYDFVNKRIINLSASRLTHTPRPLPLDTSSFSRKLSTHPLEVLKDHTTIQRPAKPTQDQAVQIARPTQRGAGNRNRVRRVPKQTDVPVAVMGDISLPAISHNKAQIGSTDVLRATGQVVCLHTRHTGQPKAACQDLSTPSEHSEAKRSNFAPQLIRIPAAGMSGRIRSNIPAPTVTLELDSGLEHVCSPRTRDVKMSPRFVQCRYSSMGCRAPPPSSSSRPHTEEMIGIINDIPLIVHGYPEWADLHSKRANNQHVTPGFQHLPSESPDCMLIGAKFTEGHLILMDKEGVVIQRITESESEANFDSRSLSLERAKQQCLTPPCGSGLGSRQSVDTPATPTVAISEGVAQAQEGVAEEKGVTGGTEGVPTGMSPSAVEEVINQLSSD